MFERFTDQFQRVVARAQEEARLLNHDHIGTEHLLLGLLVEGQSTAAEVLAELGVRPEAVRAQLEQVTGQVRSSPSGLPFSPRAKKVVELSVREALELNHDHIGTEHLLLGLAREGEGGAARVLGTLGTDLNRVRSLVIQHLGGQRVTEANPGEVVHTVAAARTITQARALAQGQRVGSHHYLLALLAEEEGLAAKVLASFGITRAVAERRVSELGTEGTADEMPEEAGGRRIQLRVVGDRLEISVEDPELARGLGAGVISGMDPAGARFPELWKAIRATTADVVRRSRGQPDPEWQPEGWDEQTVAGYVVRSETKGPVGRLTTAQGIDEAEVRAVLAAWAEQAKENRRRDTLCTYLSVLVRKGPREGEHVVTRFTYAGPGSQDRPAAPLASVLAFAARDLRGGG
ncbi:MAG: Clp protease N-terminal domain-containing protein [Acidimicrobiales bacterium]